MVVINVAAAAVDDGSGSGCLGVILLVSETLLRLDDLLAQRLVRQLAPAPFANGIKEQLGAGSARWTKALVGFNPHLIGSCLGAANLSSFGEVGKSFGCCSSSAEVSLAFSFSVKEFVSLFS